MRTLRRVTSVVLVIIGAATLAVGAVLWWADRHLFDTESVLETTDDVLTSPDVQALLTARITTRVMEHIGDESFRNQVSRIVEEAVADTEVQALVKLGVRDAHRLLVDGDVETIPLRLSALNREIRANVIAEVPELAGSLPPTEDVLTFDLLQRSELPAVWRAADRFHEVAAALISVGAVLVGLALVIGPARWIRLMIGGITFAAFGFAGIVALSRAIAIVEDRITDPIAVAATRDIFDAFFTSLDTLSIVMIVGGLLAATFGVAVRLMRPEYSRRAQGPAPWG